MAKKKVTLDLINKDKFESLVRLGLSNEELYSFFMVSCGAMMSWVKMAYQTREPWCLLKKMRVEGKIDFLSKQRKLAEKNPAMSIWFGKNYYEQTDEKVDDTTADFEDLNPLIQLLKDDEDGDNDN